MNRHERDDYYVVGEGVYRTDQNGAQLLARPSTLDQYRKFRFSRLGPMGDPMDDAARQIVEQVADVMAGKGVTDPDSHDPVIPAGFTYLGQFVDHDLTLDKTAVHLGQDVSVAELIQGRSVSLDLDSLYGLGPARDPQFYDPDGVHLRTGSTVGVAFPPDTPVANADQAGFDLPRSGQGATPAERRAPVIPDSRNDENLVVAQTHLMFIRFHNTVAGKFAEQGLTGTALFEKARAEVTKHYQWILRTDFLPRIVDQAVLDDVFTNGRKFFEVPPTSADGAGEQQTRETIDAPTMPVEFSVASYRLGHSMVRDAYEWNAVFRTGGPGGVAPLGLLFRFTGTSGNFTPGSATDLSDLNDVNAAGPERLPSNWIADFRRLYDFSEAQRPDLKPADGLVNVTKRIDTLLVDPLRQLPEGAFDGRTAAVSTVGRGLNLAFRNLTRAGMVRLATGQQMAAFLGVEVLKPDVILAGNGGAVLPTASDTQPGLTDEQKAWFGEHTPLWFYILREAEVAQGKVTGVGARIVAEVFHAAMEASANSIVRDQAWRPSFGPDAATFRMVDMLLFAVAGNEQVLFPLG
ncbi:peroxidase family protein [Pseudonocardia alaniniphila]|uniref:Heme peroxidase family protein n=1 Tax=Pseudonocardia alaniniphila TaxID=75291 RepID=A0ABS9TEQ6_9PSEU|nr:heme peroxidase family protein [Pseudonocardia alaniniphila]MCH6166791.1 heme peroxidase family protein [Pseudonocardia alaniniphila]